MKLAMVGLGKMGMNMVRRLHAGGHELVVYDTDAARARALAQEAAGITAVQTLAELGKALPTPRALWIMVPAGEPVDGVIAAARTTLAAGDVIVDGGNSNYKDSVRRARDLASANIDFLDCGTSGGVWGLENGFCLMVGGARRAFDRLEPALRTLAPPEGYLYAGPAGAGHYAKMIHNGIEYGLMQSYAEGFEILGASGYEYDLRALAHLWNRGSVVRSWLLELCERAFAADPHLEKIAGYVEDSGEGRWTVAEAIEHGVPAPVITASLLARLRSRQEQSFSAKILAALRAQFGGHAVKKS